MNVHTSQNVKSFSHNIVGGRDCDCVLTFEFD